MTSPRDLANGAPWWLKQAFGPGLAIFLLLWLLGALPFMPTPVWGQVFAAIEQHDRTTKALLRVQRLTCSAAWKGEPDIQRQCWEREKNGEGP